MKIGQTWGLVILLAFITAMGNTRQPTPPNRNTPPLSLTMRLAEEEDLEAIMKVFYKMTATDRQSLIILPGAHQRSSILKAIQNKHLFIALSEKQKVLAVLKIFLITDQNSLQNILRNELRILPWEDAVSPTLLEARFLHIRRDDIANFSFPVDRDTTKRLATPLEEDWDIGKIATIYCGSCFTREKYRGCKIASQLEAFAFDYIRPQVVEHLSANKASRVGLLFGKVQKMYFHQGLIRSFMTFIAQTPMLILNKSCISLFAWSFLATLPQFELGAAGELIEKKLPIEEWQDYGCAFIYDVL